MINRIAVFIALLFMSAAVVSIEFPVVQVLSPVLFQPVAQGEPLQVSFTTNYELSAIDIAAFSQGAFVPLYHADFTEPNAREFTFPVDTAVIPVGSATIIISPIPHSEDVGINSQQVPIQITPPVGQGGEDLPPATVVRDLPAIVVPGGFVVANLTISPNSDFPGIIMRESIPNQLLYTGMGGGLNATYDDSFTQSATGQDHLLKIVGRRSEGFVFDTMAYTFIIPFDAQPGDEYGIDGNWSTENENGIIMGNGIMRIPGDNSFNIPECPLTDQHLLEFISQWAREEITNNILLQAIERWKICGNAVPF